MGETPEQQTDPDLGTSRDELRDLESRQTGVLESDANGNNPDGLAGDMGISSERTGDVPGSAKPATHGTRSTTPPLDQDPPPEQSPDPEVGGPETPTPEDTADYRRHEHDPGSARPHSHG